MLTLLNLLSAVALLVWGTHITRSGIMRVYGADLRRVLSRSVEKKPMAFLAGIDEKLEMRYLEHVITELNDLTPDFHNRLVELYVGLLTREQGDGTNKEWVGVMARFVEFLRQSRQYSLTRAFGMIPREGEWRE